MRYYGILCVLMDSYRSSWVLIGPYASLCVLLSYNGPYKSLCVYMDFNVPYGFYRS